MSKRKSWRDKDISEMDAEEISLMIEEIRREKERLRKYVLGKGGKSDKHKDK